jgi:aspartate carbamoyltransferase
MPAIDLLFNQHILSSQSFNPSSIELILETALCMENAVKDKNVPPLLNQFIFATLFFEPSTRTRLSFETAILRLGAQVVSVEHGLSTSTSKGESLEDMAKIVSQYVDMMIVRHPKEFSVQNMSKSSLVPVINAGDGSNEHPTQALLDIYTIFREGKLKPGMTLGFLGDLRYGRTVHSLVHLLKHYAVNLVFISPKPISMPDHIIESLDKIGVSFKQTDCIETIIKTLDVLYVTRIQEERFEDKALYQKISNNYKLSLDLVRKSKDSLSILHPLPRVSEMDELIDQSPKAVYFKQAQNGLFVRMALLSLISGKITHEFLKKWS